MQIIKQIRQIADVTKFSWAETFSDSNGKSSMLPILGAFVALVGSVIALYGTFKNITSTLDQGTFIILTGSSVVTGHKIINGKPQLEDVPVDNSEKINSTDEKDLVESK